MFDSVTVLSKQNVREIIFLLLGVIITSFFQFILFYFEGLRENRRMKRVVYSEFLSILAQGLRLQEDIFDIENKQSKLTSQLKNLKKRIGGSSSKLFTINDQEAKRLSSQIEELRIDLKDYRKAADISLSDMRIYAPGHILKVCSVCRTFLDKATFKSSDFSKFIELQNTLALILRRDINSQALGMLEVLRRFHNFEAFANRFLPTQLE